MGIIRKSYKEIPLTEIINTYLQDTDIVIIEGYKSEEIPKIEVFRTEVSNKLVCKDDRNLIAVVGNKDPKLEVPFFNINEDISTVIDFLISNLLKCSDKSHI